MKERCKWCKQDIEIEYHDKEWGVAVHEDAKWFEFIVLDTFQAGLSWLTILRKRENFRIAFDQFDYQKIALYGEEKQASLMQDAGIIRNKAKIAATITNAQAFMKIQEEFGSFDVFIWDFVGGKPIQNAWESQTDIPASSPLSDALSKTLSKRGFKFVGTTICYAFMQAGGLINDHLIGCFRYQEVKS